MTGFFEILLRPLGRKGEGGQRDVGALHLLVRFQRIAQTPYQELIAAVLADKISARTLAMMDRGLH